MKVFWLKIIGIVVLILAAIIVANTFWSPKPAPIIESKNKEQLQQESNGDYETQPKVQQQQEKQLVEPAKLLQPKEKQVVKLTNNLERPQTTEKRESVPTAEELYQIALSQKQIAEPSYRDYEVILECCHHIFRQYPTSPQAQKAKELLHEVPQQYQERYNDEMRLLNPPEPKVKKSRTLRRRPPMPYRE